ncbi:Prolipoprotein diacylglyceryl transferase [Candidatus Hepatincolaceae symbiont of Richtersius coronifer]
MFSIILTQMNPVAVNFGILEIRWYSLAYIFGAIFALLYIKWLNSKILLIKDKNNFFDDLLFYIIMGILVGGRLGYVIFYGFPYYLANPFKIFFLWEGGMSFHGALIGGIIAAYILSKKYQTNFFTVIDIIAPSVPIGLFLGRIANFINVELYGKPTSVPWGVVFPNIPLARHPSQLYEAALEGIVLFIILYFLWRNKSYNYPGKIAGYALMFYGIFRIWIEFYRLGEIYFFNLISLGQLLSLPMVIGGIYLIYLSYKFIHNKNLPYNDRYIFKTNKNKKL